MICMAMRKQLGWWCALPLAGLMMLAACAQERPEVPVVAKHDQELLLTRAEFEDLLRELAPAPDWISTHVKKATQHAMQIDLAPLLSKGYIA